MARNIKSIHLIFQKEKNGNYTKNALLYQDILLYAIARKEEEISDDRDSFRHWDLAEWLMTNNQEFINRYKDFSTRNTPIKNRIENTQERTKDKLHDLVSLELIRISGTAKQKKGTGIVHLYEYTFFGYLLAWIIESFNHQKRNNANKQIYNLFDSRYKAYQNSSYYIFASALYRNYVERGVFGEFVVDILRKRLDSNIKIWSMQELLASLNVPTFDDIEKTTRYMHLWNETLNELNPTIKMLFLHKTKLDIEREMEYHVISHQNFERVRFDIKEKYDMVVMEGHCRNCNQYWYGGGNIVEYLEAIALHPTDPIMARCPTCNIDDSSTIHRLGFYH